MKKILLVIAAVMTAMVMQAVPANPQPVKVKQPDGTYVTIQLHGDEWLNFTTTEDGYSVVKDSRGYYVYAELKGQQLRPTAQIAHDALQRSASETAFLANVRKYQTPAMKADMAKMKAQVQQVQRRALARRRTADLNNFRGLVILVQYNDKEFSRSDYKDIVTDMLNEENYPGFDSEAYTGSVRDYFSDNSNGKFKPQFDLVGPYTIDHSQYEGRNNTQDIVNAAVDAADADVDFSQYDVDENGVVDLVYFLFAGNGSNYSGNDERLWWPHRSVILGDPVPDAPGYCYNVYKDGVMLWDYASSVELAGWVDNPSTVMIDGIGTICHEFSHVLGLPDFYDTDYAESGGQSINPGLWSVMAGGSYQNNSRTPSGYSLYERYLVGFIDDIPKINEKKSYTLEPLHVNQKGYRIDSPVKDEFFLLENRQNDGSYKWDAYLPGHGLLAYRVDRTNLDVWNYNKVNADPAHNYYEILWAGGSEKAVSGSDTYPGENNVTELTNQTSPANLLTHNGSKTAAVLHNIQETGNMILFDVALGSAPVKPTDVTVSDITTTSATVTWRGFTDKYEVCYGKAPTNSETCDPVWLKYDDETYVSNLGNSSSYTWTWGVMYPGSQVTCSKLTKLSLYEVRKYITSGITVNIYSGGNDAPGTLLHTFSVSPEINNGFHEVTLASPVMVTPGENLWITLTATGTFVVPLCASSERNNQWICFDDSWVNLGETVPTFANRGWGIRAYIEPTDFDGSAVAWNTVNTSGSTFGFSGLTPKTTYVLKVRGDYGSDGYGPWTEINAFTTAIDQLTLDETSVEPPAAGIVMNLKVNRTITANEWSTICLPFAMTQAQFQNAFGNDALLKEYKGYTTKLDGSGTPTAIVMKFDDFEWTNPATKTVAGTPYLIKTTKDIESFDVNNVNISTKHDVLYAGDTKYNFVGKFKGVLAKTTVPKQALFISNNKFYYSTGKTNIKAFRGWFELQAIVDNAASAPVYFSFDDETTGIQNIQRTTVGDDVYYNLNGQRVENPKKGQIYIKNNKKVVVK